MAIASGVVLPETETSHVARRQPRVGRKPRIVLVQTQADGVQQISRILGCGLRARGYEVRHAFLFRRTGLFDADPNVFFCAPTRPATILGAAQMFAMLVRFLKETTPDAVVSFQHYGNISGTVAARLAGTYPVIANRVSAKTAVPRWAWRLEHGLGLAGLFSRIVVNSEIMEKDYQRYPRWFRARVVRIEHGFEPKTTQLSRNNARNMLGLPSGVSLLGSVARLHPSKNLAAAVRLLAVEPAWHLALAGYGPARSALVALANSLGAGDRLHFAGELLPAEVAAFLKALDLFVFPSLAETFGLAVVEAAQAGVPVVANDIGILRDVLSIDGKPCALLVNADDTVAFAEAVRTLLADQNLQARLTQRGRMLSVRYSIDAMVDRYADLIDSLLPPAIGAARR